MRVLFDKIQGPKSLYFYSSKKSFRKITSNYPKIGQSMTKDTKFLQKKWSKTLFKMI